MRKTMQSADLAAQVIEVHTEQLSAGEAEA